MAQTELQVIEDWAVAASLLDPSRQRVLERLVEPDSATGVARGLGLPRQRVAYHVRELERHGLVEAVEERRRGNCIERVVRATARRYVISPAALGALGITKGEAQDALSSTYLLAVAAQTIREVGALREDARRAGKRLPTLTLQLDMKFATGAARAAFAEELAQFFARSVDRYHDADAAEGRMYRLNVTGYPAPSDTRTVQDSGGE
jgi:DNA-binding transcriptional ArsR family regulator